MRSLDNYAESRPNPDHPRPVNLFDWNYWLTTWPHERLILSRVNQADSYPRALTPLTQDIIIRFIDAGIRRYLEQTLGAMHSGDAPRPYMWSAWGHIYVDADLMAGIGEALPGSSRQLIYQQYMGLHPDPTFRAPPVPLRVQLAALCRAGPAAAGMWHSVRTASDRFAAEVAALKRMRPATDAPDERECLEWLARIEAVMTDAVESLMIGAGVASATFDSCEKVLTLAIGEPATDLTNRLHSGLGGNDSADAARFVARLADLARTRPAVAEAVTRGGDLSEVRALDAGFAREVTDGLDRFGCQTAPALELSQPTWRQQPSQVLSMVARRLRAPDLDTDRADRVRTEAEAELGARIRGPIRRLVDGVLALSRRQMALRENGKAPLLWAFDELRRVLEAAGPLLVARGALPQPADTVYLRYDELKAVLAGADAPHPVEIERRRDEHRRCLELALPELLELGPGYARPVSERAIRDRGLIPPEVIADGAKRLVGVGVSGGRACGAARVMLDPLDEFEPGEVLVAPYTDPGWSSALSCAAAVILDVGGNLSHGAVVARELGIPCVVNVKAGTRVINNGTQVIVDGSTGEVLIET
jgi:phosphohistidine swiveling domain-containing protein